MSVSRAISRPVSQAKTIFPQPAYKSDEQLVVFHDSPATPLDCPPLCPSFLVNDSPFSDGPRFLVPDRFKFPIRRPKSFDFPFPPLISPAAFDQLIRLTPFKARARSIARGNSQGRYPRLNRTVEFSRPVSRVSSADEHRDDKLRGASGLSSNSNGECTHRLWCMVCSRYKVAIRFNIAFGCLGLRYYIDACHLWPRHAMSTLLKLHKIKILCMSVFKFRE